MSASKIATTVSWVVTGLAAFVFLASGAIKLRGSPELVQHFQSWGFDARFLGFVGAAELVGALGLLVPPAATLAASGLAVILVGASFTHLTHGEYALALVPLVLLSMVSYLAAERRRGIAELWKRLVPAAAPSADASRH